MQSVTLIKAKGKESKGESFEDSSGWQKDENELKGWRFSILTQDIKFDQDPVTSNHPS